MFLKHEANGKLVEVLSLMDLFNPNHSALVGRYNAGEELQEPEQFAKADLIFPSGEKLPQCWVNVHYRDAEVYHYYHPKSG
jgi:hypothetical protein